MPELVRLYIRQSLIGFGIAAVFVALLLWFNVANLWHLVTHTREGWFAVGLLVMFNGIVFSGVQFGIAIMRMGEEVEEDDDDRGGSPAVDHALVPIPIDDRRGRNEPRMRAEQV